MMLYNRWRFSVPDEDYRPLTFPPPGPYWCSGYDSADQAILVAYLPVGTRVNAPELWPDAQDINPVNDGPGDMRFTSRFPRPDWWTDDAG